MTAPPNSSNLMDAGASAALKHTDLSDGIHEDVSSDLARESGKEGSIMDNLAHGPGKQGTNLDSFARGSGKQGSILDNLVGSSSAMGADAKTRSNVTETVGADGQARYNGASAGASSASNATEFTDGIYEDSSRRTGQTQSMTENVANKGSETISSIRDQLNTSNTSGQSDGKSIFGSTDSKSRSEMLPSSTHGDSMIDKIKENLGGLVGKDRSSLEAKSTTGTDGAVSRSRQFD